MGGSDGPRRGAGDDGRRIGAESVGGSAGVPGITPIHK